APEAETPPGLPRARSHSSESVPRPPPQSTAPGSPASSNPGGCGASQPPRGKASPTNCCSRLREKPCDWWDDVVAMQGAAQPVLGLRALTDQARAVRDEASQLAHVLRRDPHRRNESCRQESGPLERI